MSTYSGSTLTYTLVRDTTPATSATTQTWAVYNAGKIRVESFVADIRSAGDYTLKIDGATVATVTGVSAAASDVSFTPAAPVELAPGTHTFVLTANAAVTWYGRGNLGSVTGTGTLYTGSDVWQEQGTTFVPGTLNFKVADEALVSYIEHNSTSGGSFAAQTWTVTFDTTVQFTGILKWIFSADATGYVLNIDGTNYATTVVAVTGTLVGFVPASPVSLSAGAHTFKITPSASRRMYYTSGTTTAPSGDAHTTAWGVWSEASGNKVPARIFYTLPGATNYNGAAAVAGTDAVSASGFVGKAVGAAVAATVAIVATGVVGVSAGANISETATISADGAVVSASESAASVDATGTIAAAGTVGIFTSSSLDATGTIAVTGAVGIFTSSTVDATGTIVATGVVDVSTDASIAATATVSATGTVEAHIPQPPVDTPPARTLIVGRDVRTLVIAADNRLLTVGPDNRVLVVSTETRTVGVTQ